MKVVVSALQAHVGGSGVARYQREIASACLLGSQEGITVLVPTELKQHVTRPCATNAVRFVRIPSNTHLRNVTELLVWQSLARSDQALLSLDISTWGTWGRCVAVVHDISFQIDSGWYTRRQQWWKTSRMKRLERAAAAVACVSEFVRSELLNRYPALEDRTVTIRSAITRLPEPSMGDLERVAARVRKDCLNLLLVGAITAHKGTSQFLAALRALSEKRIRAHGWLIGRKGWRCSELVQEIGSLEERGLLTWLTDVTDGELAAWYRTADLVLHCSKYEGFGFVPGEAYLAGGRVLCRRLPPVVEYLGDVIDYFDESTGSALAERIENVLKYPPRAQDDATVSRRTWADVGCDLCKLAAGDEGAGAPGLS